jgi:hypothetical protein
LHASIKQNHTRERRIEVALFTRNGAITTGRGFSKVFKGDCRTCGKKVTNLIISGKRQPTKTKSLQLEKYKYSSGGTYDNIKRQISL